MRPAAQPGHCDRCALGFELGAGCLQAFLLAALLVPIQTHKRPDDLLIDMRRAGKGAHADGDALRYRSGAADFEPLELLLPPLCLLLGRTRRSRSPARSGMVRLLRFRAL